jgi:hypothetical protein
MANHLLRAAAALILAAALSACGPSETRPGLWLSGEDASFPADWRFTDADKQIAIEVHTPYLLPHSVTIWCAEVDGQLYVAANQPQTKHWPGWVDDDPDVRLAIEGKIYSVRLVPLEEEQAIAPVRRAYQVKYALPDASPLAADTARYWHVTARSG